MSSQTASVLIAQFARAAIGHLLYKPGSSSKAADYYHDLVREGLAGDAASLMRIL